MHTLKQEPVRRSDNKSLASEGGRTLIATGIFPPDIGGPATMLSHLAHDLTERGFEIKILTYTGNTKSTESTENTIKIYRINKNNKLKYFWQMWKLAHWADLIYTTDTYSVGYFAYLIKKLTGKKYILRFTGDSAWETARTNGWTRDYIMDFNTKECHPDPELAEGEGSRGICNKIKKLKKRRNKIFFNADKIIVDCEFNKNLAEIILDHCHAELVSASLYIKINFFLEIPKRVRDDKKENKIIIIKNAIDFDNSGSPIRACPVLNTGSGMTKEIKQKFSPHGEKIILTACRLTPWKGVDKIIEILPELIKKCRRDRSRPVPTNDIKFLILGQGSEMENLKKITAELNLENNVYFLGKINQEDIANYFKAADVFILNSQYEGLSHTLLEVMQAGVPIIASNCGGNPELIGNNKDGILVEYNNKQEILAGLEKILCRDRSGPVLAMAENAREKVKKFKWSEVVEKTVEVIENIYDSKK